MNRSIRTPMYRGFTLVELMLVTLIICLLAAILFPVFARAREKAYATNCNHNLREVGVALHLYAYKAGGRFPARDNDFAALSAYVPDREILACPTLVHLSRDKWREVIGESYRLKGGLAADALSTIAVAGEQDENRHNDGSNFLFLDGHARWFRGPGEYTGQGPRPELGKPFNPR